MPALNVPLYISVTDVANRMQLDTTLTGVTETITTAIQGAVLRVGNLVGGSLLRTSRSMMYYLDKEAFSGLQPGNVFRVELPSPFVRKDTPVTVKFSTIPSNFNFNIDYREDFQQGPFGPFVAGNPDFYTIDYKRGYIYPAAKFHANKFMAVTCDTGFEPGTNYVPCPPNYQSTITYSAGYNVLYTDGVVYTALISSPVGVPTNDGINWSQNMTSGVGAFDMSILYNFGAQVTYLGNTYTCLSTQPLTGVQPNDDGVLWSINMFSLVYDATGNTTYMAGQMVISGGFVWQALQLVSAPNTTPTVGVNWTPATLPIEQVPQNLYEAIMALVPSVFDSSQITNRNAEAEKQYKKATDHAMQLLRPYMRLQGFNHRPLWESVQETTGAMTF